MGKQKNKTNGEFTMDIDLNYIGWICPNVGNSDGSTVDKNSPERQVELLLLDLIKRAENDKMKGFYCGIFSAYTSMIVQNAPWYAIRFMFDAANDWNAQEIDRYV